MNKKQLTALMESLGVAPSKKLGQNFLVDQNFVESIVRDAKIRPDDRILEIGPGFGALTGLLLETGAQVAGRIIINCYNKTLYILSVSYPGGELTETFEDVYRKVRDTLHLVD